MYLSNYLNVIWGYGPRNRKCVKCIIRMAFVTLWYIFRGNWLPKTTLLSGRLPINNWVNGCGKAQHFSAILPQSSWNIFDFLSMRPPTVSPPFTPHSRGRLNHTNLWSVTRSADQRVWPHLEISNCLTESPFLGVLFFLFHTPFLCGGKLLF